MTGEAATTKEVVDEFNSGFNGETVMKVVPADFKEEEEDLVGIPIEKLGVNAGTEGADQSALDAPPPAVTATPEAPVPAEEGSKQMVQVPADEYQRMLSTVATLEKQFGEHGSKIDKALGKIGGFEGFVAAMQKNTPSGEAIVLSDEDMAGLSEKFPNLSKEMQTILNTALSKVKGTGQAVVQTVDDNRISAVLQPMLEQERTRIKREMQREEVLEAHPDFDEIRISPDFIAWKNALPPERKAKVDTAWSPRLVISVMDDYKEAKKAPVVPPPPPPSTKDKAREEALRAAVTPRGSGPAPGAKKTSDDEAFAAGYAEG